MQDTAGEGAQNRIRFKQDSGDGIRKNMTGDDSKTNLDLIWLCRAFRNAGWDCQVHTELENWRSRRVNKIAGKLMALKQSQF